MSNRLKWPDVSPATSASNSLLYTEMYYSNGWFWKHFFLTKVVKSQRKFFIAKIAFKDTKVYTNYEPCFYQNYQQGIQLLNVWF